LEYDLEQLRTPAFLIDLGLLKKNVDILTGVKERCGAKILMALKAYSAWSTFDIIKPVVDGTNAASLFEAKLGSEFIAKEKHICSPAYIDYEMDEVISICDHIIFNSIAQFEKYKDKILRSGKEIEMGLRINPAHSEVKTAIYDPCAANSRLGITIENFPEKLPEQITGLHFHTLCELNSDSLERTLKAVEEKFGKFLVGCKWVNFGGGHHVTRSDYDIDLLCKLVNDFKTRYDVEVIIEPGEAIALNAGFLISSVLDIVHNDIDIAILDSSASTHMPDVLEMPYRPVVTGGALPGEKKYSYRLAGRTCLAGDIIGDYSFDEPLHAGDKIIFHDMAHYSMVKTTMFNGLNLPDIVLYDPVNDQYDVQKRFSYCDFKSRMS